jgi:tRNASer (uridine44-2'-O)-methyltransferase
MEQNQADAVLKKIMEVVERECSKDGGVQVAARLHLLGSVPSENL